MMIVDGMVVSFVNVSDKGVGFKVMCKDFGDTFRVFIPTDNINGEHLLNMYDSVKVDFNEFFPSGNEVCMEVKRVTFDNGKKVINFNLIRAFRRTAKNAGIEDFRFHDLRHTFATRLAQAGVDLYKISKLLGHKDIKMTQRYSHHCPDSLRDGVEILDIDYN